MPLNSIQATRRNAEARQHGAMEFTPSPTDLDKVRLYRLARIREQMAKRKTGDLAHPFYWASHTLTVRGR